MVVTGGMSESPEEVSDRRVGSAAMAEDRPKKRMDLCEEFLEFLEEVKEVKVTTGVLVEP